MVLAVQHAIGSHRVGYPDLDFCALVQTSDDAMPLVKTEIFSDLIQGREVDFYGDHSVKHIKATVQRKLRGDPQHPGYFEYEDEGLFWDEYHYYWFSYISGPDFASWATASYCGERYSLNTYNLNTKYKRMTGGGSSGWLSWGEMVDRWDEYHWKDREDPGEFGGWDAEEWCSENITPYQGNVTYTPIPAGELRFWPKILGHVPYGDLDRARLDLTIECLKQVQAADNNIANIVQAVDLINDLRNIKVSELVEDVKKDKRLFASANKRIQSSSYLRRQKYVTVRSSLVRNDIVTRNGVKTAIWDLDPDIVADLRSKRLRRIGKVSGNAWLSYRYLYNTTKMDFEQKYDAQLKEFNHILVDQTIAHPLRANMTEGEYICNMKMRIKDNISMGIQTMMNATHRDGLFPDLHVVWDMIPYSFVVDWFVPVDKNLSAYDELFFADGYDILECLFSYKWTHEYQYAGSTIQYSIYCREFLSEFPVWSWSEDLGGFAVQKSLKRTADGFSLVITRL